MGKEANDKISDQRRALYSDSEWLGYRGQSRAERDKEDMTDGRENCRGLIDFCSDLNFDKLILDHP